MTEQGINHNQVEVCGRINSAFEYSHEIFGEGFYTVKLLVNRLSEEMQFTIRYRKGIDKNMKIRYKDQMYGIDSVENENEADRFLILHAEAVEDENKSENNIYRYV